MKNKKETNANSKLKINTTSSIISKKMNDQSIEDSLLGNYDMNNNDLIEEDVYNENKKDESDPSVQKAQFLHEKNAMNDTLNDTFNFFTQAFGDDR
jgi:hypothetical protein